MPFDYKKEYKEFYLPKNKPAIVNIPKMNFVAVRGHGDPNEPDGAYKFALTLLYGIAFTIKMSRLGDHRMDGFFDFVVPPLEGFWWQDGVYGIDYTRKEDYCWISLIRLPDFVTEADFAWAMDEVVRKKKLNCSRAEFFTYDEGLCVQCMHMGPYDTEPETVARMNQYIFEHGYETDINDRRYHHEIYLSDARRCSPERLKTVIRHPIRKAVD